MEAMASGLPTVTTRWNGASALVSGSDGYVLEEPTDITALSEAMRDLLDRKKREEMGMMARKKLEGYTITRNVDRMERIFQEVVDGRLGS
jgi:UDP-glucose:(heptosyl)LPS alpha-1,3-glucosyltransferase